MERVVLTISSSSPNTLPLILKSRRRWHAKHSRHLPVVSSSSSSSVILKAAASNNNNNNSCTTKTIYKDNFFDRIAIYYISHSLQHTTGMRNEEKGYESLVAASRALFLSFDSIQQRQLVLKVLLKAFPKPLIFLIRKVFPPSRMSRQICAAFTSIFFRWLVGPCEVRKSEFEGVSEKNVVYINKCRFLETSNCAGMCTNLCKIPTQEFMKNTLGIPINMVPNFDDLSCEYIFGEHPPALQDDPALKQPCYKLCNMKHKHDTSCIN